MSNSYFEFKEFKIFHNRCAMKVGTDSVLLGAWIKTINAQTILDIGTGSGLLALMMAQRQKDALIVGVEIDKDAAQQAKENIISSSYNSDRIKIICTDIRLYSNENKFDIIISNPPFFNNSLKSPNLKRNIARHTDSLNFEELMTCAYHLLNENGEFSIIIPYDVLNVVTIIAASQKLYISRKTMVYSTFGNNIPKRVLLSFRKVQADFIEEKHLAIRNADNTYTTDFISLTKDFYKFFN